MKTIENVKWKKRYNTLELKYECLEEELTRKLVELNELKQQHKLEKKVWKQKLEKQEEKIIELKKGVNNDTKTKSNKVSRKK